MTPKLKVALLIHVALNAMFFFVECSDQPNIVFILADDLGFNDVGYRGNNQVKTPNIDALAYNGAVLEKFYTLPMCTPSRAAILTGKYPIRTGFQGIPMGETEERHIPRDIPTLPEQLKKLGYRSHLIGKWHLGYAYRNVTPIARGFDSHYGYYNGLVGYFSHQIGVPGESGLDFRDNWTVNRKDSGRYATDLFTNRAVKTIREHNYQKPLFMMLSHLAVHTGKTVSNQSALLEPRDPNVTKTRFGYIKDPNRRLFVDVLETLDESIGIVIKALEQRKVLDNTIILLLSDNGAPTSGEIHPNFGSNWPLRGIKIGHYEGAIRGTGVFYSKNMMYRGKVNSNLMHFVDLLPTFYAAGGGNVSDLGRLDGINQLDSLMKHKRTNRKEVLVNIEEIAGSSAIITDGGRYKLIKGIQYNGSYDDYAGVSGRLPEDGVYDVGAVIRSDVNKALAQGLNARDINNLRRKYTTRDCRRSSNFGKLCELCLFNLDDDPCETTNIARANRGLVNRLSDRLKYFHSQLVPQQSKEHDARANPKYFGGVWTYWLDKNPL